MSPFFGVKIVTPELDSDVNIKFEVDRLPNENLALKVANICPVSCCWMVTFTSRRANPVYIKGSKLYRKGIIDETLSGISSLQGMPELLAEINKSIDEELEDAVGVTECRLKRDYDSFSHYRQSVEIEVSSDIAQRSYLYIDDIGHVLDGGYRYVVDVPAFADKIMGNS